jgi:hypothetical protein
MEVINKCTREALNNLACFLSGKIDSYELKTCLFGPVRSNLSPIANIGDNNYTNRRLALEDVTAPPIKQNAVPGQSIVDKKRKHAFSKASNAKRSRYNVPPAEQEPPPVYDYHYHQRSGYGFHFTGYEQRLPQIQHSIRDAYSNPASANLSAAHLGYGQNPINPSGPGFVMMPNQFSHGAGISPNSYFSHRYRQPDWYGRFRE